MGNLDGLLLQSGDLLARILDSSPVPTFVLDTHHVVTHWNPACESILGTPASAMIGTQNQWQAFYTSPRPVMADIIIDGADNQSANAFYGSKWRPSPLIEGAYEAEDFFPDFRSGGRWLYFTAAPLRGPRGELLGAIETLQDITPRKQAEQNLRELNETLEQRIHQRTLALQESNTHLQHTIAQLQEAQQQLIQSEKMAALGGLVAGVAHEINTPVGIGITATSSLDTQLRQLRQGLLDGSLKKSELLRFLDLAGETTQMLQSNLQRAAEQIRSFKQVAVDQGNDQCRELELHDYMDEIISSLSPQLRKHAIEVRNNCPPLMFRTYPGSLYQIISNLVMNSLTHAFADDAPGCITIEAQRTAQGWLELSYQDDGCGIPAEHLGKIFDPFFTTRRGLGGSGLGLHIVFNLATQKLGGRIQCQNRKGARFELTFPPCEESPHAQCPA